MAKTFIILALFLALTPLAFGAGSASDKIWVGLYLAENGPPPSDATPAPEKLHHRLHDVFGFKHYNLIKAQEVQLDHAWEHWFLPRKDFFLRLEPLPHSPGDPHFIDYEIYKDGFIVAKGKYEPHAETPLFINGPDYHQGRLIVVLEAR